MAKCGASGCRVYCTSAQRLSRASDAQVPSLTQQLKWNKQTQRHSNVLTANHLETAPLSLFLGTLIFIGCYGEVGQSLLAVAFSFLAFKYYFVTPFHSLPVTARKMPRLVIFSMALVSSCMAQT